MPCGNQIFNGDLQQVRMPCTKNCHGAVSFTLTLRFTRFEVGVAGRSEKTTLGQVHWASIGTGGAEVSSLAGNGEQGPILSLKEVRYPSRLWIRTGRTFLFFRRPRFSATVQPGLRRAAVRLRKSGESWRCRGLTTLDAREAMGV